MTHRIETAHSRLRDVLSSYPSLVVAYSGGVDSGLLAFVARGCLGERMVAAVGISPSLGAREEQGAIEFLERHEIPYVRVETGEIEDPRYRRNHPDRCYFCKHELFTRLDAVARESGFTVIAYGANLDDRSDHRPGARAAAELKAVAPLVEAGFTKSLVRELSRALGLELWDKPAAPCLASRVPYFQDVTPEKLAQIEAAENLLKDLGFRQCRVRHYGDVARIEVPVVDHDRLLEPARWSRVEDGFRLAGFERVLLEPDGLRSGRLNDALRSHTAREG